MVPVSSLGAREGGGEQPGVGLQSRALGSAPASGLLVEAGPQRLWRTEGRGEAQPAVPGTVGRRGRRHARPGSGRAAQRGQTPGPRLRNSVRRPASATWQLRAAHLQASSQGLPDLRPAPAALGLA